MNSLFYFMVTFAVVKKYWDAEFFEKLNNDRQIIIFGQIFHLNHSAYVNKWKPSLRRRSLGMFPLNTPRIVLSLKLNKKITRNH